MKDEWMNEKMNEWKGGSGVDKSGSMQRKAKIDSVSGVIGWRSRLRSMD